MSVIPTKAIVNTLVLTLQAPITVNVTMDIVLMVMTRDVHVSWNSIFFINLSLVITCFNYYLLLPLYIAVCDDSCNQCTECVSPGLCTCDNGWTGNDCCKGIV